MKSTSDFLKWATISEFLDTGGKLKAMNTPTWSWSKKGWQIFLIHPAVVVSVVFPDVYENKADCQVVIDDLINRYELGERPSGGMDFYPEILAVSFIGDDYFQLSTDNCGSYVLLKNSELVSEEDTEYSRAGEDKDELLAKYIKKYLAK